MSLGVSVGRLFALLIPLLESRLVSPSNFENGLDLSIVLPCLNEEAAVGQVVDDAWTGIRRSGRSGEVIVIDNGSTDRSPEIAEERGARVVHEERRGYGSAYLRGLEEARGDIIVMADADGTYPLEDLGPFIHKLEEGDDLVIGSRFRGRIHTGAMPWAHKWIGNPILTKILNIFFGVKVSDAHCGLRAIRRSALPTLELQTTGMEFASEMILKAAKRNLAIGEVPISYHPRQGESKLNTFRDGWRHLRFMLLHSSTFLFLIPGAILLALGLAVMIPLAAGPVTIFGVRWHIHAMIAGSTATLVGGQVVQLGLFARSYAVLYLRDRDPMLERLWTRVRLEHGLLLGAALFLSGLSVLVGVFVKWAHDGFGALELEHPSLLGLTLIALGVQTIFGSFFLSVLGLRKHLVLEAVTRHAEHEDRPTAALEREAVHR
jgi:glycosyltransferase involved in cell wall biosynthesis